MKRFLITRSLATCTVLVAGLVCSGAGLAGEPTEAVRLSEPVVTTEQAETFGSALDEAVPATTLEKILNDGDSYVGESVRVEARVAQVCQKKGCFFFAQDGNSVVRVSFKDYGFFVPTDISGKRVTLVGEVVAKEVTPEAAAHFAEDMGEDRGAVKPGLAYEIVATSVRIPRG